MPKRNACANVKQIKNYNAKKSYNANKNIKIA